MIGIQLRSDVFLNLLWDYRTRQERMDWLDKVIEKIREWVERVIDAVLSPQTQPQPIPIPVEDFPSRRR